MLDLGDGSYAASYRVLPAGATLDLDWRRPDQARRSRRASSRARRARATRSSRASGRSRRGKEWFLLTAVDCYGNTASAGGDPWSVVLASGRAAHQRQRARQADGTTPCTSRPPRASGNGDGRRSARRGLARLGAHRAGPHRPHASIAVGEGTRAAIGEQTVIRAHKGPPRQRPRRGRRRGLGDAHAGEHLLGGARQVRDTADGSHTLTYRHPALPHDYLMSIRVNNASLGGSPFRARHPGPTSARRPSRLRSRRASPEPSPRRRSLQRTD